MTNEQAWFLIVLACGAVAVFSMLGAYIGSSLAQERRRQRP